MTPTGEGGAIRTEGNANDTARMPGEGGERVAGGHIPHPDGIVVTPTGEGGAIRTERNAIDTARMPGKQCYFLIGSRIVEPNSDGSRNGEQGAIGGVGNLEGVAFAEAQGCAFR